MTKDELEKLDTLIWNVQNAFVIGSKLGRESDKRKTFEISGNEMANVNWAINDLHEFKLSLNRKYNLEQS